MLLMQSELKSLWTLSELQDLVLNNNQFSGLVPQTLFNQSSIRRIQLSFNSFSGTLPDDMCDQLVKLRLFFISGNKFTGPIPSSINKCRQLRYLSMSTNNFNGSIPREIGNLTLLKELFLGENDLQGMILSPTHRIGFKLTNNLFWENSYILYELPHIPTNMLTIKKPSHQVESHS
ncbi:putative non-specific serine/threonine protein kinase [Helianthus debilis subsp. tardiflorus]